MNLLEQIKKLQGGINYINSVLSAGGLQAWEAKEYNTMLIENENELAEVLAKYESCKHLF
jgi:hypothetical protein